MDPNWLDQELKEYAASGIYPFHMPGHKRQVYDAFSPGEIDITEVEGFDNLHHAQGILANAQARMAKTFGAYKSFFLVNGSTAGLLAAISSASHTGKTGRILLARNCHRAVYHAVYLNGLAADYLYPAETRCGVQGSIRPQDVKKALKAQKYDAVVITSPTYDGVVSDIRAIADTVHAHGIPLIVDEAHGAHFGFSKRFPEKAHTLGADYCIESLHKTLPAYTQSAVLHIADSPFVREKKLSQFLSVYQSSSPSYILMAGMDRCTRILREDGARLFEDFCRRLDTFYEKTGDLKTLETLRASLEADPAVFHYDPSKILLSGRRAGLSGEDLMRRLRTDYELELEMAAGDYATALTGIMDTEDGFTRLSDALYEIDRSIACGSGFSARDACDTASSIYICSRQNSKKRDLPDAFDRDCETVFLREAAGRVSGDFVLLYPPGIPVLVPGEEISSEMVTQLTACIDAGLTVIGIEDEKIFVIK